MAPELIISKKPGRNVTFGTTAINVGLICLGPAAPLSGKSADAIFHFRKDLFLTDATGGIKMEVRGKVYTYRTSVKWTGQKMGVASSPGKPDIQVATPPEFKGHEGIWSPEDLYVASVNVCVLSTFLAFAERAGLSFTDYESDAEGRLELVDGKFQVTSVTLRPKVTLKNSEDAGKAKELLAKADANCLISNSIKTKVMVEGFFQ
jgi:peroxiredoxin-like protein